MSNVHASRALGAAGLVALLAAPLPALANGLCNGLPVTILGTNASETLTGTEGNDVIAGLDGDDIINGLGGNDTICGGNGNDTIDGGPGDNALLGDNGNDTLIGGAGNETFAGGNGDDTITTGDGNDRADGGNGNDSIDGGRGDDFLRGGNGDDSLLAGLGTDTLQGGRGFDRCDGGIGQDEATDCEQADNVGLLVKQVRLDNGGFTPRSGPLAGQVVPGLDGALFLPKNARKIAVLVTHGAVGSFRTAVPGWLGWWLEPYDIATLALNRRDSVDYGPSEGGGGTLYEDTLCDAGVGVDYLKSLGFEQVIVIGHSKGTTVSAVYPSWYNQCPGKTLLTDANDPNVAGVVTIGTVRNSKQSGVFAPYGAYYYDVNAAKAQQLIAAGLGDVVFPPGAPPFFGPQFFIQPPGFPAGPPPLPAIPFLSTPRSYASYNGPTTRRNLDEQAPKLTSPLLIFHAEGDRTTPRAWSDQLFAELSALGKDVSYETPPYESLGYPNPATGGNAHSLTAEPSRFDAALRIYGWATAKVPGVTDAGTAVNVGAVRALPDFVPALQPSPTVP